MQYLVAGGQLTGAREEIRINPNSIKITPDQAWQIATEKPLDGNLGDILVKVMHDRQITLAELRTALRGYYDNHETLPGGLPLRRVLKCAARF